jgi:cytochrome c oxidase assembly factor CtaG
MRALIVLVLLAAGTTGALAHGGEDHGAASASLFARWTFDPWIVTPLLAGGLLYGLGTARVWRSAGLGHGIRFWRAAAYASGWLSLAGALVSPLHWLGEHLFTAHMIEHEIIMAIAAPLIVLARPLGALFWALPKAARRTLQRTGRHPHWRLAWKWLTRPRNATALHGIALWAWHAPPLMDLTITDITLHRLQHLSFFGSALLFWWAMVRRADYGSAAGHVFITMLHMSVLGALIALAPHVLYGAQTLYAPEWGLTPLEDQQLAGLVMWVPAGTIYAGAALAFVALWIGRSSAAWRNGHALQ